MEIVPISPKRGRQLRRGPAPGPCREPHANGHLFTVHLRTLA
jgi:hypothetical protein